MQMENFAPIMFAGLVVVMLVGFPVAFSLAALGVLDFAGGDHHELQRCL
jgi:TRAP-type mannitol/chloroaromatic compound transport system permease large subunit